MPPVRGARTSNILEALTGADVLVSALEMPVMTETLIRRHVERGALLVQRKSGLDLPASIGPRLNSSLAKMREVGACQWQCVLLSTGVFIPNAKNGTILVGTPTVLGDGRVTWLWDVSPRHYKALQSALRRYILRGGVYVPLCSDEEIPGWLRHTERDIITLSEQPIKEVWPDDGGPLCLPSEPGDPLQEPVRVTDWRARFAAAVPGVGPELVTRLQAAMAADGAPGTLLQALAWASSDLVLSVPGWGRGKQRAVREALGLEPGQAIKMDWRKP